MIEKLDEIALAVSNVQDPTKSLHNKNVNNSRWIQNVAKEISVLHDKSSLLNFELNLQTEQRLRQSQMLDSSAKTGPFARSQI